MRSFLNAESSSRNVATRRFWPAFMAAFRSSSMRACMGKSGYHRRPVILRSTATKNLLSKKPRGQILRFAQDDKGRACRSCSLSGMRRFLVGTAGHIDHGKTALVKALTGIDADRLPEEKRRGI